MQKVWKIILLLMLCLPLVAVSQNPETEDYQSEFIWGINKNTSGGLIGGFIFRKSKRINEGLYQSLGVEVMNVKHPQEFHLRRNGATNSFILGKVNYLYALRFQYGREMILFRKAPQQGVEIKLNAAAGPSLGLLAPYYVEIASGGSQRLSSRRVPYDPNVHSIDNILGSGYVLQGVTESKLRIGANLKTSMSFELGTTKNSVTGVEVGFLVDAYTQRIELMSAAKNKAVFPTAFFTLFYGSRR
ncbi:hypothetical protein FNH22_01360 [Fulvivirga sp. M361]|uniref:hypothetical protein n=1 Tax=Fulvivirga sp. M361 TaxID=2594266 RepID=UPI001179E9FD|nr:hypothetical protein [Fulvivirga sp. M361]TRX62771.1 hypothetical protein FNH22_01360 [Fulvivirga sp. M361]